MDSHTTTVTALHGRASRTVALLAAHLVIALALIPSAPAEEIVPTDGMVATTGTNFVPGTDCPNVGDTRGGNDNPRTLCGYIWKDLGRNTRTTGQNFDTSTGTHYATNGFDLLLLEGSDSTSLSGFGFATDRYIPLAPAPEAVWDGGDFQYGDGVYYATVGTQFDPGSGSGKGSKLYAYDPNANAWAARSPTSVGGLLVANEALAYEPVNNRLYATIVAVLTPGGDPADVRKLAIYDPISDTWTGTTSAADVDFGPGSELEYLDGKIYAWPGLWLGGAVDGSDSYLYVYDIASDTWSTTPTLQDFGVIPGFRSGALDVWGVGLSSDPGSNRIFVIGGETNRQFYVFDAVAQSWAVGPTYAYDGGWGDSMEYLPGLGTAYQIDGRNALGEPQGTANLIYFPGDLDGDCDVDLSDLATLLANHGLSGNVSYEDGDIDCDGDVDLADLAALLAVYGVACG